MINKYLENKKDPNYYFEPDFRALDAIPEEKLRKIANAMYSSVNKSADEISGWKELVTELSNVPEDIKPYAS